ncbi:MAG: TonB family protein [bacterium]
MQIITLRKTLLISILVHFVVFSLGSWNAFFRPKKITWSVSPVELVNIAPEKVKAPQKAKPEKEKPPSPQKIFKRIQKASKAITEKFTRKTIKQNFPTIEKVPSSVEIEVQHFPFTYYLEIIRNKINNNWQPQKGIGHKEAVAFFKIARDGSVRELSIEKSSGISFFDRSALRAVMESEPFPPLPAGFNEQYLSIHLSFKVKEFEY